MAKQRCDAIVSGVGRYFVGNPLLLRKLLAGALANGHVLFEDYPGLGKTLLVKVFAKSIGCGSTRVQFTPDILPADIVGSKVWNPKDGAFRLQKGPIFTNVLLADEINRAPPKTQSALLEAMEERQVTIEGETLKLAPPFFVLATQNPIEQEGT
ncbi:MAG TPA: AAA family ATPase, partial [Candidatus Thermoplasmatota archaeon]|nr:AAA family ATPase [Candidatus Thermoplasmatota archaeon]